ncbi:PF05957 family protein [Leptospira yanagawae serovar Saopaulo str. Sao Paulo = ATCC 700523]|uniref:DUF883 family protein n=2 Tax=Leptospira yanagawae TaxID=293069 RepID=A0ABY2M4D9_9LEPT|nr:DUF883 family protein [Leptospira yanagawae]EOQ87098.1 PF05957 family protein [Leptospira yanagawae serovar Saopaulo str. Sao Paulo = ATCC 700523]TGL20902.1 DUF883 family protein [Leptospira yanagawae]
MEEVKKEKSLIDEIKLYEKKAKEIEQRAKEKYMEQVSDIKQKLGKASEEASIRAKEVIDNVGNYVKENPQKAAVIGFGVGLGLGLALGWFFKKK